MEEGKRKARIVLGVTGSVATIKLQPLLDDASNLLCAPCVERVPEAGAEGVADQVEPHALMIRGSTAVLHPGEQRTEEFTQQRCIPRLAGPEDLIEVHAQALHVAGLGTSDRLPVDRAHRVDRFREAWVQLGHADGAIALA